ncbi:class I SAM-dependent methyltransferase [Streptomyces toxytricini]|uniref:Class I SAM-dependent methyltransferase n=1 Tax=Streptomyces toxytricini TaxID=67369 RepID=A0ABW8EGY9_STRT5
MRFPYDTLGEEFPESTTTAAYSAADTHTLLEALDALGGVHGLDTLDLACGHGHNTRLLARGGARRALGVDTSEELVRRARAHAGHIPGAVAYVVADTAKLPRMGPFDLVTAAYLFNQAPDRTALHAMFRSIRANLRDGGRLLATVPNAGAYPHVDWSPYGVRIVERIPAGDAPLLKAQLVGDPAVVFEFREWAHSDFAEAAVEAGFATVGWQPNRTPPADAARDEAYWTAYRAWPVSSLMTCTA